MTSNSSEKDIFDDNKKYIAILDSKMRSMTVNHRKHTIDEVKREER